MITVLYATLLRRVLDGPGVKTAPGFRFYDTPLLAHAALSVAVGRWHGRARGRVVGVAMPSGSTRWAVLTWPASAVYAGLPEYPAPAPARR